MQSPLEVCGHLLNNQLCDGVEYPGDTKENVHVGIDMWSRFSFIDATAGKELNVLAPKHILRLCLVVYTGSTAIPVKVFMSC